MCVPAGLAICIAVSFLLDLTTCATLGRIDSTRSNGPQVFPQQQYVTNLIPMSTELMNSFMSKASIDPVPVMKPYIVPISVPQPVAIPIYKLVPKEVERKVPITVEKLVPVYVDKPYKIEIEKHHPVEVEKKYEVKVPIVKHVLAVKPKKTHDKPKKSTPSKPKHTKLKHNNKDKKHA